MAAKKIHGHSYRDGKPSKTYRAWASMISRCTQPSNESYESYHSRGIKVCERWMEFKNFLEDMGEKPAGEYSLDRINNSGDYEPGNCRWATAKQQQNNRRSNRLLVFSGETMTLTQWAERIGIKKVTLIKRLEREPVERALTRPLQIQNHHRDG